MGEISPCAAVSARVVDRTPVPSEGTRRPGARWAIDASRKTAVIAFAPGNRLEALRGDRQGQHSIRVNDQWRVCFAWRDGEAWDVEIVDYH